MRKEVKVIISQAGSQIVDGCICGAQTCNQIVVLMFLFCMATLHCWRSNKMDNMHPGYFCVTMLRLAILPMDMGTRGYRTRMAGYGYTFISMDIIHTSSVKSWVRQGYCLLHVGISISYPFILTCGSRVVQ
jgi:hypothetical protein